MLEGATLGDLYYPLVAAFQFLVAGLFLATGRASAVRLAFALVLGVNGLEALHFWAGAHGAPLFPEGPMPTLFVLDKFITVSLPFLASQFPGPLGGPRGAAWARRAWLAALAGLGAFWLSFAVPVLPWATVGLAGTLVSDGAIVLAAGLLAAHTLPRALRLQPGPLRTQSLLVAAGLGLGIAYSCALFAAEQLFVLAVDEPLGADRFGLGLAGGYFLAVLLARAAAATARGRRRDAALLAAGLAVGGLVGALDYLGPRLLGFAGDRPANELLTQSFRPLLFALALARYDLFEVPARWRRPVVRSGALVFALATFVLLVVLLSGQPLVATTVSPVTMGMALLLLAGGVLAFQGPLGEALAAGDPGGAGERRARLDRYRLAFERARQEPAGPEAQGLERLRVRLGVTRGEHEAIASVLEGNLVVPAAALLGAPPGHMVAGRYEVLRELGHGGQGRVVLARDRRGGGEVVLKEVLRPWEEGAEARRAALRRDAEASARVASPRVAAAFGLVEEPWQTYLVREYVPGATLDEHVQRHGPLAEAEARRLMDDVLAGLEALHGAGVLHLDLKPANVVVRPDGRAVLIDQGAAAIQAPATEDTVTQPGAGPDAAVTLRWAAPEQLAGGRLGPATDVFQAGGLLYFACTGRPPVEGTQRFDVEAAVRAAQAPRWPEGEEASPLARVVARARARDPAARFADAGAMRSALHRGVPVRARAARGE